MQKLIDLHVHSNVSDGTFSPKALVTLAKTAGLSAFALTDHDTIDGVNDCIAEGKKQGIEVVPGIELSARYHRYEIHILGYFIDTKSNLLINTLAQLIEDRKMRNTHMLEKLNALGLHLTLEDLCEPEDGDVITRAHFARALLKKGYITSREEAFTKYIGAGCPAFVPKYALTFDQCIQLIHQCGGLAILAHPMIYTFARGNVKQLISELKNYGLDGVEVIYPKHTPESIAMLKAFCKKENLLITGGSDFHGGNKPDIQIGCGHGETHVPYTCLTQLKECLSHTL